MLPTLSPQALESSRLRDKLALTDLAIYAEVVFGFKNNWHHEEWYDLLMNLRKQVDPNDPMSAIAFVSEGIKIFNQRIMVEAPREHAKSTVFSVIFTTWVIGNNPNIRIVIASSAQATSELFLREITQVIEKNENYIRLFGRLKPKQPDKWTDAEIIVRRTSQTKDATVAAISIGGQVIARRADIVICDDILTLANTRTAGQREFVKEWFYSVLYPLVGADGQLIVVGTPWNLMDLYQQLLKDSTFQVRKRYDAIVDEEKKLTLWPSRWDWDELMERRESVGVTHFNRSYRTLVTNPDEAVFQLEWLERARERGRNRVYVRSFDYSWWDLGKVTITTGTDLAISKAEDADETAHVVLATTHNDGTKIPLWVEAGHYSPAQTRLGFVTMFENYNPQLMMVENNAYQESIRRDLSEQTSLPVKGYTTGGEKFDPEIGINSLAVEFENDKWILPYGDEYSKRMTDRLIEAMMNFPQGHTDDALMALWFANTASRDLMASTKLGTAKIRKHGLYRRPGVR